MPLLSSRGPGPPWRYFLLLLAILVAAVLAENKEYQINTLCKSTYAQHTYKKIEGAVLRSQNERNLDCIITFQTNTILQRFMLRFDALHLDCNDHLYIFDGAHAVGAYKADLNCRNTKQAVGAIFTRTNFVTLKYVTDSWGTDSNGFDLVITAVKDPKHSCKEFRCTLREFCIATDLVCDGVNHCADGSDEAISTKCSRSDAGTVLGMSTTLFVIVVVVSCLLVLCACVAGLSVCLCRREIPLPTMPQSVNNANFPLQQMHGSNGMGAMTMVSKLPGNWCHPAGLQLGYSAGRVRLYCQAK